MYTNLLYYVILFQNEKYCYTPKIYNILMIRIMFLFRLEFTQQSRVIGNIFLLIQYREIWNWITSGSCTSELQTGNCIKRYYDNKADNLHVQPLPANCNSQERFFFSIYNSLLAVIHLNIICMCSHVITTSTSFPPFY